MPLYEFHCEKCDKDSEILVRSRTGEQVRCAHCGSKKLTRKLSVFAAGAAEEDGPTCTGNPSACGRCAG